MSMRFKANKCVVANKALNVKLEKCFVKAYSRNHTTVTVVGFLGEAIAAPIYVSLSRLPGTY